MYDLMIIGAGPGGYTAANKAAKNGLKVVLFEKKYVGGTCLNRGCIPMKSLIASANLYDEIKHSELYGIEAKDVSFNYDNVLKRKDDVVTTLRDGVIKSLNSNKVDIIYGQASLIDNKHIKCNDEIYEGNNIIIASGSIVSKPPIEGIELAITSDEILEENFNLPQSLTIIGGGVIGVEIGDALSNFGCKVTIIEMMEHLLPSLDKDLGQRLAMFFKKKNIDVICQAAVNKIEEKDGLKIVHYTDKKGEQVSIESQEVLIATGRKANIDAVVQDYKQLEVSRGIVADELGKTNIDNIFVIGDAKSANIQLAHVAEAQAENIIDYILNKQLTNDISVIPSGIYTKPEIASVGILEKQAKENNIEYEVKKYLTGANGKSLIENSDSGFVKLIISNDIIIGGQIVSMHATELIGELAIAVEKKMSLKQFYEVVHPHPTISEMLWHVGKE